MFRNIKFVNQSSIFFLEKKTIIFDLDETLIHCNENTEIPSDVVLTIRFPQGEILEVNKYSIK